MSKATSSTPADSGRGLLLTLTDYNLAGQPVAVTSSLIAADGTETELLCISDYDSHGRPTESSLRFAGQTFNLGSTTYDRLGRAASVTAEGGIARTLGYDLHGWLTDWSYGNLSQSLLYASGTNPSYTGRISAKSTQNDSSKISTYNYTYDRLGRLTAANFRQSSATDPGATTLADYSTAYTYDLQGNILTLNRKGPKSSKLYGVIDEITATYQGNQIASLRDDAPTVLLESSLDMPSGAWSGSDFAYDHNGNQTRDLSRGVADIDYNALNLPRRIEMASDGAIEYLYTAAGTKLAEIVRDSDGHLTKRRDYAGIFEFENGEMTNISLASGYITPADTTFHLYVPDHQGNIVAVYNTTTGHQEHYKDYYPYGLPHTQPVSTPTIIPGLNPGLGSGFGPIITKPTEPSTTPSTNRKWYGAKELTTDHGLNTYDFEARVMTPAFPRFTTPDPLATDYTPISPYAYCGGDPVNLIDPSGMIFCDVKQLEMLLNELNKLKSNVEKDIKKFNRAKNHSANDLKKLCQSLEMWLRLNKAINDVNTLHEDKDHVYKLSQNSDFIEHKVQLVDGIIYIQYSDISLAFHELTHVRQSLKSKKGLQFNEDGYLKPCSQTNVKKIADSEIEAYRIQYIVSPKSLPKPVGNIYQIDYNYLKSLKDSNNDPLYPYMHQYKLKDFYKIQNYINNGKIY